MNFSTLSSGKLALHFSLIDRQSFVSGCDQLHANQGLSFYGILSRESVKNTFLDFREVNNFFRGMTYLLIFQSLSAINLKESPFIPEMTFL